jgi:integrase/recombinase XerD
MEIKKLIHREEQRISIAFPYNQEIISILKQIEGAKWSRTLRAWHLPDNESSIINLKKAFPTLFEDAQKHTAQVKNTSQETLQNVRLTIFNRSIRIQMPKNEKDIEFIKTLRYYRWQNESRAWIAPNYKDNIDKIKHHFGQRISTIEDNVEKEIQDICNRNKGELYIIKTPQNSLHIIFHYDRTLVQILKRMPYAKWDSKQQWWNIPYAERFVAELKSYADEHKMQYIFEEQKIGELKPKISKYDIPNYRQCPDEYKQKLIELRYSNHTLKTYSSMFEEFINYYNSYDTDKIDERQITTFLRYLVTERKVSTSYQNQSINAIKFYYERVLGGQRKIYYIERPRIEKTLPTVLSKEEVVAVLKNIKNLKHKTIIITIYSAGLRIGEVTRLKAGDIDSDRMQIFVRQSKGKKDRYTVLSQKALDLLRQYHKEYKPKDFLFEGPTGGQYSYTSIQNILKAAIAKTNITKHTTVHTLRHSFATHMLEDGTDVRYIQSMLGHESSKTTEIYTHITTRGLENIKSPLDQLDIE